MGPKYMCENEQAATGAETMHRLSIAQPNIDGTGAASQRAAESQTMRGLVVRTGKPLSSFNANCYPLCFTDYFYAVCGPGLERPEPLTFKQVFSCLMVREELQYSLEDDASLTWQGL